MVKNLEMSGIVRRFNDLIKIYSNLSFSNMKLSMAKGGLGSILLYINSFLWFHKVRVSKKQLFALFGKSFSRGLKCPLSFSL